MLIFQFARAAWEAAPCNCLLMRQDNKQDNLKGIIIAGFRINDFMTPEEFITFISSRNPLNLKLAKDYLDKLPYADPAFQDELCRLYKSMQPFDMPGKHLEISERLRSFCADKEDQRSSMKNESP